MKQEKSRVLHIREKWYLRFFFLFAKVAKINSKQYVVGFQYVSCLSIELKCCHRLRWNRTKLLEQCSCSKASVLIHGYHCESDLHISQSLFHKERIWISFWHDKTVIESKSSVTDACLKRQILSILFPVR